MASDTMTNNNTIDHYATLLRQIVALVNADHGCIVCINVDNDTLDFVATHEWNDPSIREIERPIIERILRKVITEAMPIVGINASYEDQKGYKGVIPQYMLRSAICVPLQVGKQTGALYVQLRLKTGIYREPDLDRVQVFLAET
jgi:transcriptional regulator with GAF, ATPase, and Fis domain